MKVEIEIWNGGGWNNYEALRTLKTLPVGTRGLLTANGISRLEISPRDSERPCGIAARYFDADGELVFTQGFDQNDSAKWIRERVVALLEEGIQNRIFAKAKKLAREAAIQRITAWRTPSKSDIAASRRQFVPGTHGEKTFNVKSGDKLRAKIGQWREQTGKFSRKECWNFTYKILAGEMTFAAVREQFFGK